MKQIIRIRANESGKQKAPAGPDNAGVVVAEVEAEPGFAEKFINDPRVRVKGDELLDLALLIARGE